MKKNTLRSLSAAVALSLAAGLPGWADAFTVDDQIISAPGADIPDPEYDNIGDRMVWQDTSGRLWVADVDPVTADIYPSDGRGVQVDSGLMGIQYSGNGPEWVFGNGTAYIAYTKNMSGVPALGSASQDVNGVWQAGVMKAGLQRWNPFGTPDSNTSTPRIVYTKSIAPGQKVVAWRNLGNPLSEMTAPLTSAGGRWVEGLPEFVAMNEDANGVRQVALVDSTTGTYTQLTTGKPAKLDPYMWWAPDYNTYLLMAELGTTKIGIYAPVGGQWQLINILTLPASGKPYVNSPEPFVAGGKSYIFAVAAQQLGSASVGLPLQPIGPTEIWIAGVAPSAPFYRRIDDPTYAAKRTEPEVFHTATATVILYTEVDNTTGLRMLRRAATGLAY